MFETPGIAFVNHLLQREEWAREKLAPFAGKRVRVAMSPLPDLAFGVREGGILAAADTGEPDLTIALSPAALPQLWRRDDGVLRAIAFTGDAELAGALQFLLRHLKWDVEEDLSRVVGDVTAHRIVAGGRAFAEWQREAGQRLGENVAEYMTEEARLVASPAELARFSRQVAEFVDAVERLEKRLERVAAKIAERANASRADSASQRLPRFD
jgi:ubiquinone biosynthesis accessory factor UbiJ